MPVAGKSIVGAIVGRSLMVVEGLALDGEERVMDPEEFVGALAGVADNCQLTVVTPVPELLAKILSDHKTLLAAREPRIDRGVAAAGSPCWMPRLRSGATRRS